MSERQNTAKIFTPFLKIKIARALKNELKNFCGFCQPHTCGALSRRGVQAALRAALFKITNLR